MRFYTEQRRHYCGIDLHARTMYVCILDEGANVLVHRRIPCQRRAFLRLIEPYRDDLVVATECLFCWYWVADLCLEEQIAFVLGHAIREVLPEAAWQRCYVHFLRNALDHLPRKADDDCLQELRWLYDRRCLEEARADLAAWLGKWQSKYPKLCDWVQEHIEETWTFYRLPLPHHKHMKSTNMLERLNEEIRRRTRVVRIFPNCESCLRLVRALAVEMHENWIEATRYLNMELLFEDKKEQLRQLEEAA